MMAQCRLEKRDEDGVVLRWTVGWIPVKLAKKGLKIYIERDDGTRDYGWVVADSAGEKSLWLTEKEVRERQLAWKKHRRRTDI